MEPGELARYLGYEAVFVVAPGWLVLRAVAPGIRSRAWQLALGWPIGLTLEILAFSLTAALGVRHAFLVYPLVGGLPAALIVRRRGPAGALPRALFTPAARWSIAGLCLLAFAYIGAAYYTITPLPGSGTDVFYPGDATFEISIAASALHHWPPAFEGVSGLAFNYHYFVNLHMAAAAQVTGIHLAVIDLRLYLIPLTALVCLQFAVAGRLIGGRAWAGVLAVALFLLVREIDLSAKDTWPFAGIGAIHLFGSASQLLGTAFFVPILLVLALLLDSGVSARAAPHLELPRPALWAILAVLLVGAGGAKSVILPLLVAGLLLYLGWSRLATGRFCRTAIGAIALCALFLAVFYLLLYNGSAHGLRMDPPATITQMPPLQRVHEAWPQGAAASAAYWVSAVVVGTFMYFGAPLLGLALWLRKDPARRHEPLTILSISFLLVGVAAFFFLEDEYLEQTYFTLYGLFAVMPLAAAGLVEFADQRPSPAGALDGRRLLIGGAVWIAALGLLSEVASRLAGDGHPLRADALAYGPPLIAVGLLALGAATLRRAWRAVAGFLAAFALLLAAALDTPLDLVPMTVDTLRAGQPLYASFPGGVRPGTLEGMEWIRDHLPYDSVLAVSNDRTPRTRRFGPLDGSWPALTEHRTFREAWAYTARANELGQNDVITGLRDPFPARTALERAVFARADPAALRTMIDRYGVTDIVVSRKDGPVNRRLYRLARPIYSNRAVDVLRVAPPSR